MALRARSGSTWAGLVVVVAVAAAFLAGAGVDGADVLQWVGVVLAGVLAPGLVVVRALRAEGCLAEDLAWAVPVGLLLALLTWAVGLATVGPVSPYWTALVVASLLAVPRVRRRVLRPDEALWARGSGVAVVASLATTSAWAAGSTLDSIALTPDRPFRWSADVMFHTALAGELARTAAPQYPMVPEGHYPYHWFFHALAAHLGQGFEPLVVVTHLLPLTLLLGVVAMAAVATRVVARHGWGAAAGAAAVGLVGMTQPGAWFVLTGISGRADTDGAGLDPLRLYWQHSASTTLGWLAALGVVAAGAGLLRHGPGRRSDLALVAAMAVLAAGAKSSQLPVLLCGVGAVVLVAAVRRSRDLALRAGVLGAVLSGAWGVALLTMYAGGSQGLELVPGERVVTLAERLTPALVTVGADAAPVVPPLVGATAVALWLLPLAPRLLGLLWWVRRPLDPVAVLCAGTLVAGLAGTFLTGHPGGSEVFFLVGAYPVGVVASAAGLVLAAERLQQRWGGRRMLLACSAAALVGAVATTALARWAGSRSPLVAWREARPGELPGGWLSPDEQLLAWAAPTLILLALLCLATLIAVVLGGRPSRDGLRRRAAGILVVGAVGLAGGGLVATGRDVLSGRASEVEARMDAVVARAPSSARVVVSPALWDAAALVRGSGSGDDVVVTNRACTQTAAVLARRPCDPREFSVAALTGRRTGVSGWAYAPTSLDRARDVEGGYTRMPFWDPARLAQQRDLVERPTPERAAAAWARGERWVLADRAAGPVSTDLAGIGEVLLDRDGIVLVRLSPPPPPPT